MYPPTKMLVTSVVSKLEMLKCFWMELNAPDGRELANVALKQRLCGIRDK